MTQISPDLAAKRRKTNKIILWTVGIILALIVIGATAGDKSPSDKTTKNTTNSPSTTAESEKTTLNPYQYESRKGMKDVAGDEYHVLLSGFDLSSADTKQRVKDTVTELARKQNTINMSAYLYSDKNCYDYKTLTIDKVSSGSDHVKQLTDSYKQKSDTCVVASYMGGLNLETAKPDTSDKGYELNYFLNAPKDNPTVGSLKEVVSGWKPQP